jgi:ribose 5-phosphate isomerase B
MSNKFNIVIGSDDAGFEYKLAILTDLQSDDRVATVTDLGVQPADFGVVTYGEVGLKAGQFIASGKADRGILLCGTGLGVAIAANKVPGIRAATAHDSFSVERSVLSNDCQILTLGQRVIGLELARRLVREWLGYSFDPSAPSNDKVAVITAFEQR